MPLDDTNWSPAIEVDETTALLIRARGFLERGWCREAQALDTHGVAVMPTSERAVVWCAFGALRAAGMPLNRYRWDKHPAVERFHTATGGEDIGEFNNRWEIVEPVLAAFDRAIAAGHIVGGS